MFTVYLIRTNIVLPDILDEQVGTMHDLFQWPILYLVQMVEGIVMFISFFISLTNIYKNRKKWNKEIENNIFRRQLVFIIIRMFTMFFSQIFWHLVNLYNKFFVDFERDIEAMNISFGWRMVFQSINISRGIFYALWLLADPLIRKAIHRKYEKFINMLDLSQTHQSKKESQNNVSNHPMNAFLCSSMNMELVCAIL